MRAVAPVKKDAVLASAVDLARAALAQIAEPGAVGGHLGMEMLGERLAMHWFECTSPGYLGWRWGVSVARIPRAKVATVCETNLLPGPGAIHSQTAPGPHGPPAATSATSSPSTSSPTACDAWW